MRTPFSALGVAALALAGCFAHDETTTTPPPATCPAAEPGPGLPLLDGPDGSDPHGEVRSLGPAIDQEDTFFRTGVVQPYCDDLYDPG